MIKIELPKQGWIESANQDFIADGFWKGAYAINIIFTGAACDSQESMIDCLERVLAVPVPKRKIVRLKGMLNPTDPFMRLLIKSLKDYGYHVQAVLKNQPYEWINDLSWSILQIESAFVPYWTNEVWYKPPISDKLIEPKALPEGAPSFLYLFRQYSVLATQEFIINGRFNWSLL